jgi:hypothetical protein
MHTCAVADLFRCMLPPPSASLESPLGEQRMEESDQLIETGQIEQMWVCYKSPTNQTLLSKQASNMAD